MMSLSVHKCDGAADPSMKGYSLVLDGRMCPNHGCCGRRPLCAKTGVLLLLAISCVESFPTKPLTQPRFRGPKGSREQRRQRWAMQMAVDNSSNDADAKIDDDTELPTPKGSPKTRKICLDYPSDESDGLGLAPKRMCVDYPSFAYDQSEKNRRIKKVIYRAVPTNPNEQGNAENNSDRTNQATTTLRNLDFTGMDDDGNSISVPFWKRFTSSSGFEWDLRELTNSAKRTRLVSSRSYAKKEAFNDDTMTKPPKLSDLSPPFSSRSQKLGISTPARIASFGAAYLAFPYIVSFLNRFVTMQPEELDQITSRFSPGISILYGTFVSLTLSILYRRQQDIQDHVATESSMLVFTIRGLLSLFHKDPPLAVEAGQCAADQLRTLVRSSRGAELMLLMYSDPYARMLELIDNYEDKLIQNDRAVGVKGSLVGTCRDALKDLHKIRANRLSGEALALPPTHFLILSGLTTLIFLGYSISILPVVEKTGSVSNEASLLFGLLFTIYLIFYDFAYDLNEPFDGIYQVRRSAAASHLLETKWLLVNHPMLRGKINFAQIPDENNDSDVVVVRSPGLGEMVFERTED